MAIAQSLLDLLPQIADQIDHLADAVTGEQPQLMVGKGFASHLDKRFGDGAGDRVQAGGEATCQNGHRLHENSTLVPSKSKRKRTSSNPACCMAWRRRLRSSA